MTVAIVTDSAAALPPDLARDLGVTVVPMWLTVGGEPEPEGRRPLAELVAFTAGAPTSTATKHEAPEVTTSAPTPGEFETAIKEAAAGVSGGNQDGTLVLTIAATMSATFQAASVAAAAVGGPIRVLDTATAGGAEALVVLAAADLARQGASLDEVEARARHVMRRVRLIASVPTLDHLVRSGRVPGVAGWAGRRLGINPLFEFRGGKVRRLRPALSREAALDRIVALVRRSRPDDARLHVSAWHALALETAEELLARVSHDLAPAMEDPATAFIGEFGPVMVVHTGPGLAGLAWWWEESRLRG